MVYWCNEPQRGVATLRWRWLAVAAAAAGLVLAWAALPPDRVTVLVAGRPAVAGARSLAAARLALSAAAAEFNRKPLVVSDGAHRWQATPVALGVSVTDAALDGALARLFPGGRPGWFGRWRPAPVLWASAAPERLAAWLAGLQPSPERAPEPARLVLQDGVPAVAGGAPGVEVDRDALVQAVSTAAPGQELLLPVRAAEPHPSRAEVAAMGVRRLLAEFTTDFDPLVPRGENIALTVHRLDGQLLAPGRELSLSDLIGPVDGDHGFVEAPVIAGGRLSTGFGGGVCQVASTLYAAALRAGLDIVERHPHALAVAYLPPSQDAAIAVGYQDLRVRNPGPGYRWVRASSDGGRVTVQIYGDWPPGRRVEVISRVLATFAPTTEYLDDPSLPRGARVVRWAGHPGYRSAAVRRSYDGERLVAQEQLSVDSYPPTPQVVLQGTGK